MNRLKIVCACAMGMVLGAWGARMKTAAPEANGVRMNVVSSWFDELDAQNLAPRVALVVRHGQIVARGEWGEHSVFASQPLGGLTRAVGISIAGLAEEVGAGAADDVLIAKMLADGVSGEEAGDELGALLERCLGESPAAFFSDRFMWNLNWDWGAVAARDGSLRCATGMWMHPDDLAALGLVNLGKGSCDGFYGKARCYTDDFAARHPFGVMAYDGNVLAVSQEKDAVVVLLTDSERTDAVRASVERFLATAFAEGAIPGDPAANERYEKTRRRAYRGPGSARPDVYPPLPKAPPTFGDQHKVLELIPDGKIVGRNSESDIVRLKDGRLLFAWSQMQGTTDDNAAAHLMKMYSSDMGKTWSAAERMVTKPEHSLNVMCVNFLRLKDGRLALFYLHKHTERDCRPVMRVSTDEGTTWSEPRQIIPDACNGYYVLNNAQVIQCGDGRLVVPTALHGWGPGAKTSEPGEGIMVWISTDAGETWTRSRTVVRVDRPHYSSFHMEEPGVVELKDGRLRMHFRTNANWQYVTYSSDGGQTWCAAQPSTMRAPRVSATIRRLSDGNLYAAWNDHSRDPNFRFRMPYFNGECCPMTFGVSTDEGRTWIPLVDLEREGHFCYPFIREIDGYVFMGYCCRIGMKDQRVIRFRLNEVMKIYDNVGTAETAGRDFTAEDFRATRPDGRCDKSLAWVMDTIRRMTPEYDADKLRSADELPAWRTRVRFKLKELLQIRDDIAFPFTCVGVEKRDGYELRKYEFSPYPNLVTRAWACVPDAALNSGAKCPAVVCMPGNGASVESMTGEEDACFTRYPLRNRQAYWYAKAGFVSIAMENPASAGNSVPGMNYGRVQDYYFELMQFAGVSAWGLATEQVLACVAFLKGLPFVDGSRVAASGLSLGCFATLYASVLSDDIKAVVYNDFVCSWAQRYMCVTERSGTAYPGRDMVGAYRWFDDQPDLMACLAPRPLFLVEDGHGKGCVDKIRRIYQLAGAENHLAFRRYDKYSSNASRERDGEDLRRLDGLSDEAYLRISNVDPAQHSFHPEVALPWLCKALGMETNHLADLTLRRELAAAVAEREHFAFAPKPMPGLVYRRASEKIDWSDAIKVEKGEGFRRCHYKVDGCAAWVVVPDKPLPGNPWVWEMEFPGAFGERTGAMKLVGRGFHNAHIIVGNNYACPASMRHFDAFWKFLVKKGLDPKCTPMGYSRGGLYAMRFAIAHPDRVHAVYGDAPVCDFKSWPGGTGCGKGSPADWQNLIKVYGFQNAEEAIAWKGNPISNLAGLAAAKVPLIFVVGDQDRTVPPCENAELVEKRYRAIGGVVHMFHKPNDAHHPHGLADPTPVLDLIQNYAVESVR